MNAITQLPESHLTETLARYDVGDLSHYWPAANGIENSNYFVRTQRDGRDHEFVLTILEQTSAADGAYAPMMLRLSEVGLPVAPPLPNRAGYLFDEAAGKPAMLQLRLRGQHIYNPTTLQLQAIARFVARMHLAMQDPHAALPAYPRNGEWLEERVALLKGFVPYGEQMLLENAVAKCRSLLSRHDVAELPQGMIHGDLFRDNVLFDQLGLTGVLDFHHASHGYWIYDLAVIANDWCSDASGALDPDRTLSLLRAYHEIRPLTAQELWFFGAFTLYAATAFWLSRLSVAVNREGAQFIRFKNPDEFKAIVRHLSAHMLYVDPRAL